MGGFRVLLVQWRKRAWSWWLWW